jgi:hypothetical protein
VAAWPADAVQTRVTGCSSALGRNTVARSRPRRWDISVRRGAPMSKAEHTSALATALLPPCYRAATARLLLASQGTSGRHGRRGSHAATQANAATAHRRHSWRAAPKGDDGRAEPPVVKMEAQSRAGRSRPDRRSPAALHARTGIRPLAVAPTKASSIRRRILLPCYRAPTALLPPCYLQAGANYLGQGELVCALR